MAKSKPETVELMTLKEVQELVRLSKTAFWALRKRGGFPTPVMQNPHRWRKDVVMDFLSQNESLKSDAA